MSKITFDKVFNLLDVNLDDSDFEDDADVDDLNVDVEDTNLIVQDAEIEENPETGII